MFGIEIPEQGSIVDERYTDVHYNGCIEEFEDPMDYFSADKLLKEAEHHG